MQQKEDTHGHYEMAEDGRRVMSIAIRENVEEAIETYARLSALGHFARAASLFEDVLKHYLDQLLVFAEHANFLIQQGKYDVLLDRVNERTRKQTDAKLEVQEEETVYLELLRALSMLHSEGQLVRTLEALEPRGGFYPTLIKPPIELTHIQIRSVETYLAIITAVITVMPREAIKYGDNITVQLPRTKSYIFETGAATLSKSPWVEIQAWCVLLAKEHPQEATNVFRMLLHVLRAEETTFSWVLKFFRHIRSSSRGPPFILAEVGAMNAWMSFRRRHHLNGGDRVLRSFDTSTDEEDFTELEEKSMDTHEGFYLLNNLYGVGYDARSQQAIELELNAIASHCEPTHLQMGLDGLAEIAREEANHRLENYCFKLMVEMSRRSYQFLTEVAPMLEFPGVPYTRIAKDAVELITFLDRPDKVDDIDLLHTTVSIGSVAAVRLLLNRGSVPMTENERGRAVIHQAASKGHEAMSQVFLEHDKTLLSCIDGKGYLPLHVAAENGHDALLRLFLDSSKEHINTQVRDPQHGPRYSLRDGIFSDLRNHRALELEDLSLKGTRKRGTALHLAAENGHEGVVASLLHFKIMAEEEDDEGWTALHKACARWQYGVANLLLRHGVSVNSKTKKGLTGLDLAAKSGYTALVDLLLQHHAGFNDSDGSGGSALTFAAEIGDIETARLLLKHGADILSVPSHGQAPLHVAAKNGHLHMIKLLLENGAKVELEDDSGKTALHLAEKNGYSDIVEILLDRGANMEAKSDGGKTALHFAAENGYSDIVEILLDRGANIKARGNSGKTALHLAAENGCLDIVEVLLDRGANIEARGDSGKTALHFAAENGYSDIVEVLLDRGANMEARGDGGKTAL